MSNVPSLKEDEYLEIEEAIASTMRGRAFLRMRDRHTHLITRDQTERMLTEFRAWLDERDARRAGTGELDTMQRELKELRSHIERSRNEIAQLAAKDGKGASGARLTGATEELYEIVASTERATSEILGAAEWIQEQAGTLVLDAAARAAFEARCMEIFTACSFQDITGQRIAKVVTTLAYIEQRVDAMVSMWDSEGEAAPSGVRTGRDANKVPAPVEADDGEASLLNGPQMPGHGLGQDAVDALFGSAAPAMTTVVAAPATVQAKPAKPGASSSRKSAAPATPKTAPPAAATSAASPAKLAQSDVDALFN